MFEPPPYCVLPETVKRETLPYYEYYLGGKDEQNRRHGVGHNCWTGAESIEWHCGRFLHDTMHGPGEYRCRYKGSPGLFVTYEGRLYMNHMHGYGALSYPNGMVFTGLFNKDVRYGPGVETFANVTANVGLWRGPKLVRLTWRPAPFVVPDFAASSGGRALVDPHRVVLQTRFKTINKVNQAIEFLKQHGSDPMSATENWTRLYPTHCTDAASQLCHVELFDYDYYDGKIYSLKELDSKENYEDLERESQDSLEYPRSYYAWNNGSVIIDVMKHSFKHEKQRKEMNVNLKAVLNGARSQFKPPAKHELDCRTLLLACFSGHVASTTYLVNECGVDPNIADMVGNSAVMYAVCGDQVALINFLVEAGANVNGMNDSCCTPLAVALIRFMCASRDVPVYGTVQALIPPPSLPVAPPESPAVLDWNINRELQTPEPTKTSPRRVPSKLNKLTLNLKNKSLPSVKDPPSSSKIHIDTLNIEDDLESKLYRDINTEYIIKVTDLLEPVGQPVAYLFTFNNMMEVIISEQTKLAQTEKKDLKAKSIKEVNKPSKEMMWQNPQKEENTSVTSAEIRKAEICNRMKLTILQLLEDGAKPSLVRCPQPALVMAVLAGCADVVKQLIRYGANVNEVYPQHLNYTPLDMAVSQPLNQSTLELVQTLLSAGAIADHRLNVPASTTELTEQLEPGPTLLHYVLAKKAESEIEEDIRKEIVHLLIEYNCDPLKRYKGHSALDEATKNLDMFDVIITNPKTDLNAVIDDSNQTILMKMFYMPYFKTIGSAELSQTLTNLLLFGADPLIKCESEGVKYENLFVMVRKILYNLTGPPVPALPNKHEAPPIPTKGKKPEQKKESPAVPASADIANLKQAIDLMTECSRILYIRWLQTQLTKQIILIVDRCVLPLIRKRTASLMRRVQESTKSLLNLVARVTGQSNMEALELNPHHPHGIKRFKHRHWSMIIKEFKNKKAAGLWITAQRCFEIWGHLKTTQKKIYKDRVILWNLLCIAHFLHIRSVTKLGFDKVTVAEKCESETCARNILRDNKSEIVPLQRYVRPELFVKADAKYNVCFECFLPLTADRILCKSCKFVSFCNMDCLIESIEKSNGHACNDYLILKYLPESLETTHDVNASPKELSVTK